MKHKIPCLILTFITSYILLSVSCTEKQNHHVSKQKWDLEQIKDSGTLTVLTMYGSTSFFIYRGQDMGFQYDLAEQFAKSLGVKLVVKTAKNVNELVEKLLNNEGDLIAYYIPITRDLKDSILYCGEEIITHQEIDRASCWDRVCMNGRILCGD